MATNKRITLHPLDSQGKMDTSINLYPKTLRNAIINDDGTEFDVAPNPEEEATEELVKIKINDTIYDISGGSILELDNETGTLTDKQIELLEKPDTVIFSTLDNNYYFLSYADENNLYFYTLNDIISISEHSEEISLTSNYFEIDTINKTYGKITNSNLIYTKDAINNFLSTKEYISNKVTSLSADSTDTQYPSAKAVYDNFVNLREVAEGKCKTFVLRYSQTIEYIKDEIDHGEYDKITDLEGNDIKNAILNGDYDSITLCNNLFNSQNDTLDFFSHTDEYLLIDSVNQNITSGEHGNISYLDTVGNIAKILNLGDIFLIKETQVPDRWVSLAIHNRFSNSFTLSIMETAKVDISNMVTTNTDQTITGVKRFNNTVYIGNYNNDYISITNGDLSIRATNSLVLRSGNNNIIPYTNNSIDLGSSTSGYKDLYLNGKVDFGTKVSGRTNTSYITTDQYDGVGIYVNGIRPINIYDNGIYLAKPILPNTTTIDIGGTDKTFRDLYLSGGVKIGSGNIWYNSSFYINDDFCSSNDTISLGKEIAKWKDLYLSGTVYTSSVQPTGDDIIIGKNTGAINTNCIIRPTTTDARNLGDATHKWKDLYLSGKCCTNDIDSSDNMFFGKTGYTQYARGILASASNGLYDLGRLSNKWKDLYLSGNISDGTNSVSVANITSSTFNVINATDIVNNTLTQEQYDLITNGKPTLIKGTWSSYNNLILLSPRDNSTYFEYAGFDRYKTTKIVVYNDKRIATSSAAFIQLQNIDWINGKAIPAYPSSTGTFNLKQIDGTLTWTEEWYGTQAEYDALGTYDNNTIYNIIEE